MLFISDYTNVIGWIPPTVKLLLLSGTITLDVEKAIKIQLAIHRKLTSNMFKVVDGPIDRSNLLYLRQKTKSDKNFEKLNFLLDAMCKNEHHPELFKNTTIYTTSVNSTLEIVKYFEVECTSII